MDPMAEIKQTYFQECDEQLAELEAGLLAIASSGGDAETVNAVFRAVHSIKGGAGAFGLAELVDFTHVFETCLDHMRSGRLACLPAVTQLMLRAADVLSDLVRAAREGVTAGPEVWQSVAAELDALADLGSPPAAGEASPRAEDLDFRPVAIDIAALESSPEPPGDAPNLFVIRFKPRAELYARANEPVLILGELARLGTAVVDCDTSALPKLDELDPAGAYLSWTVHLSTLADESAVREVFEYADGDCELDIRPAVDPVAALPEPKAVPTVDKQAPAEPRAAKPAQTAESAATHATIRVDLDRVDRLINLVGELVINRAMLSQRIAEAGSASSSAVTNGLSELEQLTREIQDSVMAIRAQPVKPLFQRMSRTVREVAAATAKSVSLVTEGEGTEVDKTVIERLADPLTHMIRNAIDHGLETAERRIAAGKPTEGVVRLSAAHRSGRILIEVADDGAGIDRQRVRKVAVDKGLIAADAVLSEQEIDSLLFLPGFSTASTISNVSGRGVGMDVVKRSIQALGGRISIASEPGRGTTFTLSLPLTLAVLDGMIVNVAARTLVVPITAIMETLKPGPGDLRSIGPDALAKMSDVAEL